MNSETPALPTRFTRAVALCAKPGSAGAHLAADQARCMPPGNERAELLGALLSGPNKASAPEWMLEAAAHEGLSGEDYHYLPKRFELCIQALTHPECPALLLSSVLRDCTDIQLARMGQPHCPPALVGTAANELRRRSGEPQPLKRDLPTPAQVVLCTGSLDDAMFDTAISLLPTKPEQGPDQGRSAWRAMWRAILKGQPDRHRQLLGSDANRELIRRCLISDLPWKVEPRLLKQLAREDLAQFDAHVVVAEASRMRRDGTAIATVRKRFAAEIATLDGSLRQELDSCLEDENGRLRLGCQATATWVSKAVRDDWRYLLDPAEAKSNFGKLEEWYASPEDLAQIGRMFAQRTIIALEMWEPNPRMPLSEPWELTWAIEVLKRLTWIPVQTKAAVESMVADAALGKRNSAEGRNRSRDSLRQFDRAVNTLESLALAPTQSAPAPDLPQESPEVITLRQLATMKHEQLLRYLQLHPGIDGLVEKALVATVRSGYINQSEFCAILSQHSEPRRAILDITQHLRARLGGVLSHRESWVRHVLDLPECDREIIRALPAWTVMTSWSGLEIGMHPDSTDVVFDGLGDDHDAWTRFASSPITHSGPGAWLRLGDLLDAARTGAEWPKPPATR